MTTQEQIDKLAKFILEEVDDKPSQDEEVVDTAIRIIREQNKKLEKVWELATSMKATL